MSHIPPITQVFQPAAQFGQRQQQSFQGQQSFQVPQQQQHFQQTQFASQPVFQQQHAQVVFIP